MGMDETIVKYKEQNESQRYGNGMALKQQTGTGLGFCGWLNLRVLHT